MLIRPIMAHAVRASLLVAVVIASPATAQTAVQRTDRTVEIRALLESLSGQERIVLQGHGVHGNDFVQVTEFVGDPFSVAAPSHAQLLAVKKLIEQHRRAVAGSDGAQKGKAAAGAGSPPLKAVDVTTLGSLTNLAGLPSQTQIIVGAADFFVTRAKDELVLAYMERLRNSLDAMPVIDSLLPAVAQALRRVEVLPPRSLAPLLRASAERDFTLLPERATSIDRYPQGFLNLTPAQTSVMQGAHLSVLLAREVREGVPPAMAARRLAWLDSAQVSDPRIRSALIVAGVVASEYAESEGAVAKMPEDPAALPYTVAYLAHDIAGMPGFEPHWQVPGNAAATLQGLLDYARRHQREITALVMRVHHVQQTIADRTNPLREAPAESMRTVAVDVVTQLVRGVLPLVPASDAEIAERVQRVDGLLQLASEVERSVAAKDYPALFATLTPFLAPPTIPPGQVPTPAQRARQGAFRVMALATALASADSASQVTAALEAAAEPVGSYRAKRTPEVDASRVSFTLNGYLGVGGGAEWSNGRIERGAAAGQFGASLPVGVELALGRIGGWKGGGLLQPLSRIHSLGLFVPLLDIGNVANFRIRSDSLADTPEIGFSQVFAPGLFLMAGLGTTKPFSVGVGAQYAPKLRKALDKDETVSVVRASMIFGIDMPVLRF